MNHRSFFAALAASLLLSACVNTVPSTSVSEGGRFPAPSVVRMKYLGTAAVEDGTDPINACRVYVFKVEEYYQTAVWCPNGRAVTSSAGHQKQAADDVAATTSAAQ